MRRSLTLGLIAMLLLYAGLSWAADSEPQKKHEKPHRTHRQHHAVHHKQKPNETK